MASQWPERRSAVILLMTAFTAVVAASCGGNGQPDTGKEAASRPGETRRSPSGMAAQAVEVATSRLSPERGGPGRNAKGEGKKLAQGLISLCNLESRFWKLAPGHAASPLIDRKRNNTFLVLVGAFDSERAAANAFPSLVTSDQQGCYRTALRELLVSQSGEAVVTRSQTHISRDASGSDAWALQMGTEVHLPAGTYGGDRIQARAGYTEARVGILRHGAIVYLICNFRWDRPPSNALALFEKVIAGREGRL